MKRPTLYIGLVVALLALLTVVLVLLTHPKNGDLSNRPRLRVAIAPYQDLAMLVNASPLGLEEKYGVSVELVTMAWEDILPTVASRGRAVDLGFGSLVEFLTKYRKLNDGIADPVVFVQPLYVYKGGGFVALDPAVPVLDAEALRDTSRVVAFLALRFGAQRQSLYEMMLFTVARRVNVPTNSLKVADISMNDGLLALQSGSLDVTAAGLTQLNEARRHGGRLVLSMEDTGFADIVGFICLESTLRERRAEIVSAIRMWFECVDHVLADLPRNSGHSLAYLRENAATQYTFDDYAAALSQEYLPRSVSALDTELLQSGARFDLGRIAGEIADYLVANNLVTAAPPAPEPLLWGE